MDEERKQKKEVVNREGTTKKRAVQKSIMGLEGDGRREARELEGGTGRGLLGSVWWRK